MGKMLSLSSLMFLSLPKRSSYIKPFSDARDKRSPSEQLLLYLFRTLAHFEENVAPSR
jgi:hypothetical protein